VITSIEISRFRGIREGKLEDLTPLTVLVGANGCGKSSVLDALLIAGSRVPGEAVGRAVSRHSGLYFGAPWLLWRKGFQGPARIAIETNLVINAKEGLRPYSREIKILPAESRKEGHRVVISLGDNCEEKTADRDKANVDFAPGNVFHVHSDATCEMSEKQFPGASLVGGAYVDGNAALHKLISEAREQGLLGTVTEILRGVVPGARELAIGTEGDAPRGDIDFGDHAVPIALCGDGIRALVSLSLELATYPKGTVLIEEPEVHQHPGAIRQSVRAILAAVRRDIQVVLTTHSLELIDAILAESTREDIDKLCLYRLELENGKLISVRVPGSEVAFARGEIEKDLR